MVKSGGGRPKGGGYTVNGKRVPSVTTIIARCALGGCDGLMSWAASLAREGVDWREAREEAGNAGTIAHNAVEAWIRKEHFLWEVQNGSEEAISRAKKAFEGFSEWAEQTNLTVTHTEIPLVSNVHLFGGTIDAALIKNLRSMGDWKTSNTFSIKFIIQLAAYGGLWNENFPDDPIVGGYHLCRFDKEYGDFSHRWWSELDDGFEAFLIMRRLYELEKILRRRSG